MGPVAFRRSLSEMGSAKSRLPQRREAKQNDKVVIPESVLVTIRIIRHVICSTVYENSSDELQCITRMYPNVLKYWDT